MRVGPELRRIIGYRIQAELAADVDARFASIQDTINRIPGAPATFHKVYRSRHTDTPFAQNISRQDLPQRFSPPVFATPYDGSTDPDDHVSIFKQRVQSATNTQHDWEICMCKSFGSTLSGPALTWFTHLPNNSIGSFDELHYIFCQHFASSRRVSKRSDDLYFVK